MNLYPFIQVRWNDHLENFPLMNRYGINTNILHLTFSRAEFWSFHIKFWSLQEYLMKKQINQPYMEYYVETSQFIIDKN